MGFSTGQDPPRAGRPAGAAGGAGHIKRYPGGPAAVAFRRWSRSDGPPFVGPPFVGPPFVGLMPWVRLGAGVHFAGVAPEAAASADSVASGASTTTGRYVQVGPPCIITATPAASVTFSRVAPALSYRFTLLEDQH